MDVFVVRHAKAGSRRRFDGEDNLRPISRPGKVQADGLVALLANAEISRMLSSPFVRCVQTLEPLAAELELDVEIDAKLGEGHDWTHALSLVEQATKPIALCSHGDVIGDLMHALAQRGVPLDDDRIEKGSTWVLQVEEGEVVKARYLEPPSLVVDGNQLIALLARGTEHADEEHVDVLAHSLQCAALLAERHPDDRELQLAGLVHDVGWILRPDETDRHAETGAAAVAPLLGHRVAWLVSWHADAKRYLVTTDPAYRARLSERSLFTLEVQGGLMDETEVAALAAAPDVEALLELRRADDDAKVPGLAVPGLDSWTPLLPH